MQKKLPILLAVSALALGLGACEQEKRQEERVLNKAPGTYEKTTSSTDAEGTTTEQESSTDIRIDDQGKKKAVIKTKKTKDPKGLLNKTTIKKSTQTIEERK